MIHNVHTKTRWAFPRHHNILPFFVAPRSELSNALKRKDNRLWTMAADEKPMIDGHFCRGQTMPGKRWNRLVLVSVLVFLTGLQLGRQKGALLAAVESQFSSVLPEIVETKKKRWPSRPLSNASLAVVLKAGLVDTSYVDASQGHKSHPHMGARDKDLNWGYVHDVTRIRRNPPALNLSGTELANECEKRDANYKALLRISVDMMEAHEEAEQAGKSRRTRILCGVYSLEAHHHKIPAIRETWGQKCDGFFVASNKTDASVDAVDIPHAGESRFCSELSFVSYARLIQVP